MTRLKICGLRREEDILCANECLPDYIGFVFAPSKRQVDLETARRLKSLLDPRIRAVGVFVNGEPTLIQQLCREGIIDLVQLHGDEDEAEIKAVKKLTGRPVIKAVQVGDVLPPLPEEADYLLFDTLSKAARGGTGKTFPWEIIRGVNTPYFLAGGINGDNARQAIEALRPFCLDVSSGAETDGTKDPAKMRGITAIVKGIME